MSLRQSSRAFATRAFFLILLSFLPSCGFCHRLPRNLAVLRVLQSRCLALEARSCKTNALRAAISCGRAGNREY